MLKIQRVKCKECGHTHALLPAYIVPYCWISGWEQHAIISAYETASDPRAVSLTNPNIDENNIKSVIKRYLCFWKQRLISEKIPVSKDLASLVMDCFSFYSLQFMQTRCTINKLFLSST